MLKTIQKIDNLRIFYVLALGALAGLSVTTHLVMDSFNDALENDGKVINIAGRQRMLSQRIASYAQQLQRAVERREPAAQEPLRTELKAALDLLYDSHLALSERGRRLGLFGNNNVAEQRALDDVDNDIDELRSSVSALLAATEPPLADRIDRSVTSIIGLASNLLPRLDALVTLYENHLDERVDTMRRAESLAYFASLSVLVIVAFFMFEPAIRRLRNQRRDIDTMRAALDNHTMYSVTDRRGRIIDVNEGFCRISGYTREELLGQSHRLVNSGHHDKAFWIDMWKTIAAGEVWRGHVCNRAKDGSIYWVDSTNVPQTNADGEIERYISWRFDITEQKKAEAAARWATLEAESARRELEDKERELRTILDALPSWVYYKDRDNVIRDCNKAGADLIHRTREEIVGHRMTDFFGTALSDFHHEDELAVMASGEPVIGRMFREELNDAIRHQRIDKIPLPNADGEHDRVVVIGTDVSDIAVAREESQRAQERLTSALQNSGTGLWDMDVPAGTTYFNDTWFTMLGYAPDEFPMNVETWEKLVHPDDLEAAKAALYAHIEGRTSDYRVSVRMRRKEGVWQWIRSIGKATQTDENGRALRIIGVHIDIQALRDAIARAESTNRELKESQLRFELALEGSRDAIFDWNIASREMYLSPRWRELLEDPALDLERSRFSLFEFISSTDLYRVRRELVSFLKSDATQFESEFQVSVAGNRSRWVLMRAAAVRDDNGTAVRMSGSAADITNLKMAEEELKRLVQTDHLTGLASRSRFLERLDQALARSRRSRKVVAVLFFDFDRFKTVNDTLGHDVGDELLCSIGNRLVANIREVDTAARFGGDEFVILLEDLPDTEAASFVADKLLAACAEPHVIGGHALVSTASIGLVTNVTGNATSAELIKFADAAMYQAKRSGRGCVVAFDREMYRDQLQRLSMEEDLASAIERDELSLVYQPIIDLNTGDMVAAEALLRWNHGKSGPIPPDTFIPIAEETKEIITIGQWVLEQACEQLSNWRRRGRVAEHFAISINVSKVQLLRPNFVKQLIARIDAAGLPRTAIKIEVTETTVVDNRADIRVVLDALRRESIVVMMDDFGTGHSSLSGLHSLPIDELKIDRSFIQNASNSTDLIAITSSIVSLAEHLSLSTVGEGIETHEHIALLQSMGCSYGQGYFWSRPLPPGDFEDYMASIEQAARSA